MWSVWKDMERYEEKNREISAIFRIQNTDPQKIYDAMEKIDTEKRSKKDIMMMDETSRRD